MVYTQSQRKTLLAWFEHDPNPDKATMEQLAKEVGIPGNKIQVWFKNQRCRQKKLESGCSLGKDPIQGRDQSRLRTKECLTKEARQDQIPLTATQRRILVHAFERNQVPSAATRKNLTKQTDIQELSIQMWFQNQRSLYPEWSRGEPINFLVGDTSRRPDQLQETGLFIRQDGRYHLPFPDSFCDNQIISPAPLPSSGIMQPTQAVQGGEDSELPLTFLNHLPELLTPGEDFSDTQVSFWTQFQEECQKQSGIGVIPLKDHSQPHPEHKEPQDLDHTDISYIMQWWDKGRQALIEEWQPLKEIH